MVTLNAYDAQAGHLRGNLALLLTVALGVSLSIAFPALSLSARLGSKIGAVFGAESAAVWRFGVRLVVVGLLLLGVETVYHFAPNARRPWRWLTPGSLLAVFLWIPATALFALYVGRFARYETLYAGLGSPVVLLIWFYLTGFAILLGGELNAEIEPNRHPAHRVRRRRRRRRRTAATMRPTRACGRPQARPQWRPHARQRSTSGNFRGLLSAARARATRS
jgi:membrane protein